MQRRLHRRGRNAIRVDDECLHEQDDRDGADDRHDPVDRDPERRRQAAGQPVDRVARLAERRMRRRRLLRRPVRRRPEGTVLGLGRRHRPAFLLGIVAPVRRRRSPLGRRRERGQRPRASVCVRRRHLAPRRRRQRWLLRGRRALLALERLLHVAHAMLRTRLCSARQPSILAWSPESKHVGDLPAAERGRPRVVRVLDSTVEGHAEASRAHRSRRRGRREGDVRSRRPAPSRAAHHRRAHRGRSRPRRCTGGRRSARRSPRSVTRGRRWPARWRAPRRAPGRAGGPAA